MNTDIYSQSFVSDLFDEMSSSYKKMNTITSFGFYPLWRKQALRKMKLQPGYQVTDLMTGMGECWDSILKRIGKTGNLTALDFSLGMLNEAKKRKDNLEEYNIHILHESVFENSIKTNSQDAVICAYGMKTFTENQICDFSKEIYRILKPGGQFSLVDVSLPKFKWLRKLYIFYISNVIPVLSNLFSNSYGSYRMLGVYSKNFKNAKKTALLFSESGLDVHYCEYFFGCATGIYGKKP